MIFSMSGPSEIEKIPKMTPRTENSQFSLPSFSLGLFAKKAANMTKIPSIFLHLLGSQAQEKK